MSNRGNEDTHKIHVQIHTGQPGNLRGGGRGLGRGRGGVQLAPVDATSFFLYTCVSVTRFSSLNSQLTAEAIGYVNVNKANTITGKEIYKINIQMWSVSRFGSFSIASISMLVTGILGDNADRLRG